MHVVVTLVSTRGRLCNRLFFTLLMLRAAHV